MRGGVFLLSGSVPERSFEISRNVIGRELASPVCFNELFVLMLSSRE